MAPGHASEEAPLNETRIGQTSGFPETEVGEIGGHTLRCHLKLLDAIRPVGGQDNGHVVLEFQGYPNIRR